MWRFKILFHEPCFEKCMLSHAGVQYASWSQSSEMYHFFLKSAQAIQFKHKLYVSYTCTIHTQKHHI